MKKRMIMAMSLSLLVLYSCSGDSSDESAFHTQDSLSSIDTQDSLSSIDSNAESNSDSQNSSSAMEDAVSVRICSESVQSIAESINQHENLKASDILYVDVPEKSCLYEYVRKATGDSDFEEYYKQFVELFEYFFPNHPLNDDYLLYTGGDSFLDYDEEGNRISDYKKVRDHYDDLASGKIGDVNLLYDESWYDDVTEWNSPVCLELGSPIGNGYAIVNKGKTVYLAGKKYDSLQGIFRYRALESYEATDTFEVVGYYSPKSEKVFKLLDKEMSIKDAVQFYENYVNTFPDPENPTLSVKVSEVFVLEIDEGVYGYHFVTTSTFDEVPFDHARAYVPYSKFEYNFSVGSGFMLESDDVDMIYSMKRLQKIESPTNIKSIVSIDEALQILSDSMTSNIEFNVRKVEFVYCLKLMYEEDGSLDTKTMPTQIHPSWKFTLRNDNDDLSYVCYVDAKDGGNFRFYTTSMDLGLLP